jgi:hypothetical protein
MARRRSSGPDGTPEVIQEGALELRRQLPTGRLVVALEQWGLVRGNFWRYEDALKRQHQKAAAKSIFQKIGSKNV